MFAVSALLRKPLARLAALLALVGLAACDVAPVPGTGGSSVARGGAVPVALLVPQGSANVQEAQLARDLDVMALSWGK